MIAICSCVSFFGSDLPVDPRFVAAVTQALKRLFANGAKRTAAEMAA